VTRDAAVVSVRAEGAEAERYDQVDFACHADQALTLIDRPTEEARLLGAIRYRTHDGVFAPQAPSQGYLDHLGLDLVLRPASLRENARQLDAPKEEPGPMIPAYPALAMPIELFHGEADQTVGLEIHSAAFARQVPRARLTRLPGIGHMVHQDATAEVVARVEAAARASG
jgi:pimeloyl-ACP methyl ester carboxylesterase